MKPLRLNWRQVHLDFHTAPEIPDIGVDINARDFAATMKRAGVNSVTVFAKCHHGHLYYNTSHPARHPNLRSDLNLLGEQVEALHHEGIRAPIYLSVQCDEYAANTYPQWIARHKDGRPVGAGPFDSGWQILDMNSPYQDYLAEQTEEVLRLFKPVDGIFFDMCWDQPSCSNYAIQAMIDAGLNPENEDDRNRHAHRVALSYMKRFHALVKNASPDASVYFNSRPLSNLAEELPYLEQVEIEALPTGGWGYMYFPKHVRFARLFGKPYMGMTARFHKSWADFGGLKPVPALEFEVAQMIAHGARCSIGDQMHPRGTLDPAAYDLIGHVYTKVAALEPWLEDATPVTEIGVLSIPGGGFGVPGGGTDEGTTRMLTQLKHQFDLVNVDTDWSAYRLLILPDSVELDTKFAEKLSMYVKKGGAIIASGQSGISRDGTKVELASLGIASHGKSPFDTTYIRFGEQLNRDIPSTDHVIYESGMRVTPEPGTQILARVVEPYFQRSWKHFSSHFQTPANSETQWPAVVQNGRVAYIATPIFRAYAVHGNYPYRLLVRNLIERLLPDPIIKTQGPTGLEVTVNRQPYSQGLRTIVHLLYFSPERRAANYDIIDDRIPLYDLRVSIKQPAAPKRVYIAPDRQLLDFEYINGRVELQVPKVDGHTVLVLE